MSCNSCSWLRSVATDASDEGSEERPDFCRRMSMAITTMLSIQAAAIASTLRSRAVLTTHLGSHLLSWPSIMQMSADSTVIEMVARGVPICNSTNESPATSGMRLPRPKAPKMSNDSELERYSANSEYLIGAPPGLFIRSKGSISRIAAYSACQSALTSTAIRGGRYSAEK